MEFVPRTIKRARVEHGNTRLLMLMTGLVVCVFTTMVVSTSYKMSSVAGEKQDRTSDSRQTDAAQTEVGTSGKHSHKVSFFPFRNYNWICLIYHFTSIITDIFLPFVMLILVYVFEFVLLQI